MRRVVWEVSTTGHQQRPSSRTIWDPQNPYLWCLLIISLSTQVSPTKKAIKATHTNLDRIHFDSISSMSKKLEWHLRPKHLCCLSSRQSMQGAQAQAWHVKKYPHQNHSEKIKVSTQNKTEWLQCSPQLQLFNRYTSLWCWVQGTF